MVNADLKALLKRVVELVTPNLRHYYRVVRKARVVKSYACDGSYWADVQPLRNDESVDEAEPVIRRVEIPVIWAGAGRGMVCPPAAGSFCDLEYYDGDPDYPRISNFRWHGNGAPVCEEGALIIQQAGGVSIKIDASSNMLLTTTAGRQVSVGADYAGQIGGAWSVDAAGTATLKAAAIVLDAPVSITQTLTVANGISGSGVTMNNGNIHADNDIDAGGDITCVGGNPNHHSH